MIPQSPIALFCHKNLDKLKITVECLKNNIGAEHSEIFIFSDGAKNSEELKQIEIVRDYIKSIKGFKRNHIIESSINLGISQSIIHGINYVLALHDQVVVIEEDILTTPYFLSFINESLYLYRNDLNVAAIHGFTPDFNWNLGETYFAIGPNNSGWGTWQRSWSHFNDSPTYLYNNLLQWDLVSEVNRFYQTNFITGKLKDIIDNNVESWDTCWHVSAFLNNMYTLYPGKSLVKHIDEQPFDNKEFDFVTDPSLCDRKIDIRRIPIEEKYQTIEAYKNYYFQNNIGCKNKSSSRTNFLREFFSKLTSSKH